MAALAILPAKPDRFAQDLQFERSLALSAALFFRNSIEPRALYHRPNRKQGTRICFQAWLLEHCGGCISD
jgi:hypothetical protein